MMAETHRFRIGAFECMAVRDGTFAYPSPAALLFTDAPKALLNDALREHSLQPEHWEQWVSPYTCLVIDTGRHHVLIDTGAGDLAPTTGNLLPNLHAEGIRPEDIDIVILTHGHPDHIGGNTDSEGKAAFPNARYVMWKSEWDFWTSSPSLAELKLDQHVKQLLLTFAQRSLPPVQGRIDLIDHETEIVPGVQALAAPGHTPGHLAVAVFSGGEKLLYSGDTAIHPIHLEYPDWSASFDFSAEQAVATRRQLLNRAAREESPVLAFHFPFPGLGHIIPKGTAWQWQPTETT